MRVLVVGSGGREYAIGLALRKDENVEKIYFAPGNGATLELGENVDIPDYRELAAFAKERGIDLTIVGPEAPLVDGIVDIFREEGLTIFGPTQKAALLEGSKIYMKNFLKRHNIPTARYIETEVMEEASQFIDELEPPIVIKADGLCAGKGVIIAESREEAKEATAEMLSGRAFGPAGQRVVIEEYLDGYELSIFAVSDGDRFILFPAAQDHKRLLDGDRGPNTGGMGAYAPTPLIDDQLYAKIRERIIAPTINGMREEGTPFEGVLFAGLMIVDGEPYVLEFNVRFGDPECEVLMPLLETPPSQLFYRAATKQMDNLEVTFSDRYAVGVVLASENYPYGKSKPSEIIIDEIVHEELAQHAHICYAGVSLIEGKLFATGGRVLVCVGLGETLEEARHYAYMLAGQVHFAGKKFRRDIAYQALKK
ncbi:MAG: phosphoribosylamine--glycine ligase [Epsilonproteobacteria bacterium]|nr:phosphoribosylamine--glycine ligase [Campylobacterota bacterium]NPA56493.1 phosphoribosylamine--glycine ligase [Campylobacterota bacterium]